MSVWGLIYPTNPLFCGGPEVYPTNPLFCGTPKFTPQTLVLRGPRSLPHKTPVLRGPGVYLKNLGSCGDAGIAVSSGMSIRQSLNSGVVDNRAVPFPVHVRVINCPA